MNVVDYVKLFTGYISIPSSFDDNEILVRILYSPYHFSVKKQRVKPEAFHPPRSKGGVLRGDVSVLRLGYTTLSFCEKHGSKYSSKDKVCQGFATIKVYQINESRGENDSTPFLEVSKIFDIKKRDFLPMHADIIMPEIEDGKPPSNEVKRKAKALCKYVTFHSVNNSKI